MSKIDKQQQSNAAAAAAQSRCIQKVLDTRRRFIDDLMGPRLGCNVVQRKRHGIRITILVRSGAHVQKEGQRITLNLAPNIDNRSPSLLRFLNIVVANDKL